MPLSDAPIEIDDPKVPLSDRPADAPSDEILIEDEDVPLAGLPNTGNSSRTALWGGIGLFALTGMPRLPWTGSAGWPNKPIRPGHMPAPRGRTA